MLYCNAIAQDARRRIVSPTGKELRLAAVRPNCGVEALYRKRLTALVEAMHKSLTYFLQAQYRANAPVLAADQEAPASGLRSKMRDLGKRWTDRFDEAAPELAKWFATAATERSDASLRAILRRGGISVKFQMTAAARDVFTATVAEQVNLIKSIAAQHLTQVEGIVMRGVQVGRDVGGIAKELEHQFGVTKRRAAFIARDQSNKATSTITIVRQRELGITQAIWLHSAGGRHPRPEHVAASGKRYDVDKGMFLEGRWTYPGWEPNCRCVSKSIIPALDRLGKCEHSVA